MKRFIVALFLVVLYSGMAFAFRPAEHMMQTTATATSGSILSAAGYLYGLMIVTDGTDSVTLNLYDSLGATGTTLIPAWVVTTSASNRAQTLSFEPPLAYNTGVYASGVSSGTFSVIFYYRER